MFLTEVDVICFIHFVDFAGRAAMSINSIQTSLMGRHSVFTPPTKFTRAEVFCPVWTDLDFDSFGARLPFSQG